MSTKIQWTDETWNPTTGCNKVSAGCKNCYAEKQHFRMQHMHPHKYTRGFSEGVEMHEKELVKPFSWRKPKRVFVNSMSDLFHKDVPFEFIRTVFGIMSVCKSHTFQILTKRPERAVEFFKWLGITDPDFQNDPAEDAYDICVKYGIETGCGSAFETEDWPLKNVWIGTSCEDQATANERIPFLLQVPAAVRFLSCEPLLGPIDLNNVVKNKNIYRLIDSYDPDFLGWLPLANRINWVIAGGESGNSARPAHPDWVRSLRDQCKAEGVPFFFKQWGEWAPCEEVDPTGDIVYLYPEKEIRERKSPLTHLCINHQGKYSPDANAVIAKGEENCILYKFGKHLSGNLLDGKVHEEFPKVD